MTGLLRWYPVVGLWLAFVVIFVVRVDPDFGWHLEAGRYIWAHGAPARDVFSYTAADFRWIDHEWLSDVLTAALMWVGGFWLVAASFAGVWTAAMVVAARGMKWPVLALGLAAVAADAVARPNAWSVLGLGLVLWGVRHDWRWRFVPLFLVWANLHGGFVLGLAVLAVVALRRRELRVVWLAATAATLVNLYGPRLYLEVWRTMTDSGLHAHVGEWAPLSLGVLSGFYIIVVLFEAMERGWRRWDYALPGVMLLLAVGSLRQFPLFVAASLGNVACGYDRMTRFFGWRRGWRAYVLPILAAGLVAVPVSKIAASPYNDFPIRQVASLQAEPCRGNVFNEYDFGGYIIWKLPGTRVYIDGRMPSWAGLEGSYFDRWQRVLSDTTYAQSEFARYNVGCALVYVKRARLIGLLEHEGWRVSNQDNLAVLLRRPN